MQGRDADDARGQAGAQRDGCQVAAQGGVAPAGRNTQQTLHTTLQCNPTVPADLTRVRPQLPGSLRQILPVAAAEVQQQGVPRDGGDEGRHAGPRRVSALRDNLLAQSQDIVYLVLEKCPAISS